MVKIIIAKVSTAMYINVLQVEVVFVMATFKRFCTTCTARKFSSFVRNKGSKRFMSNSISWLIPVTLQLPTCLVSTNQQQSWRRLIYSSVDLLALHLVHHVEYAVLKSLLRLLLHLHKVFDLLLCSVYSFPCLPVEQP